ncbi:MAG: hypothetical protein RLZ96_113 [Actinomycetota bacterium]
MALGGLSRGELRLSFKDVEQPLKELLREFGNNPRHPRPEYPFWRLKNDQVWDVQPSTLATNNSGDVSPKALRDIEATGGFTTEITEWLLKDRSRLTAATRDVLEAYFPTSLHDDLLAAVGFKEQPQSTTKRARDPAFRDIVLKAYRARCAVCRQDIRIGSRTIGLDAAHIKWHQAGGSDEEKNGLCLCSTHHKLFDLGAFTVSHDLCVLVSEHVTGSDGLHETLLAFHRSRILSPIRVEYAPSRENLNWHRKVVFKEQALP